VKPGDKLALLVTAANGTFNGMDVQLRGTFRTVSKSYDDLALRLPLAAAEHLLRVNGAQQWLVLLHDTETTDDFFRRIAGTLPPDRYSLTRWDQEAHFYHQTAELFSRQFGFMRIVITTLIVLSILNTMTMNVLERTWEVGVMLSVGDTRRQVLTLFMLEGAVLGVVGSVAGMAVGLASAVVINAVGIPMPAPPGMSHGFHAGVVLSTWVIASALCIGAITALVASLPPSIRASRMQIVAALRTRQ
jgi:putative ABC transport system permease protein